MREVKRVSKVNIYPDSEYFESLLSFCHLSKNLYNRVAYIERHCIFNKTKLLGNYEISKQLQNDLEYPDYKNMPTAQSAQQTIKQAVGDFKNYLKSLKEYNKDKKKFKNKPRLPHYKEKEGYYPLTFTNQNCKIKNGFLNFPASCNGMKFKTDVDKKENYVKLSEVKITPTPNKIVILITYTIKVYDVKKTKSKHILGIDLGINNLASCVDNFGKVSFLIDGRYLKSVNQECNKNIANYKSVLEKTYKKKTSKFLTSLYLNRYHRVEDYLHKASREIVNRCLENKIDTIVVGYNKGWKENDVTSKKFNQNFNHIPFRRFLDLLKYKCEDARIKYIETNESYTSGTSFVDHEKPTKKFYDKSRRIKRGLFKTNNGILINADINGAYQIINKKFQCDYKKGFVTSGERVFVLNNN